MSLRQQRGSPWRGQLQPPNRFVTNVVPWRILVTSSTTATISPILGGRKLLLTGQPKLTFGGQLPATSALSGGGSSVNLTFTTPIVTPIDMILPPGDPAVRTAQGDFLAPAHESITVLPWPPIIEPTTAWTADTIVGSTCVVTVSGSPAAVGIAGIGNFRNETTAEDALSTVAAGGLITVTFTSAVTNGDQISFASTVSNVIVSTGQRLTKTTVTCGP